MSTWPNNSLTYLIVSRYLVAGEGWKRDEEEVTGSYMAAGRRASELARELDARYGAEHFWTVDCVSGAGHPVPGGSYFQLFHGRLQ